MKLLTLKEGDLIFLKKETSERCFGQKFSSFVIIEEVHSLMNAMTVELYDYPSDKISTRAIIDVEDIDRTKPAVVSSKEEQTEVKPNLKSYCISLK